MTPFPQLTEEETVYLMQCEGYFQLSEGEEWKQLVAFMRDLVADAEHDLADCLSSDPAVSHALRLTWQARRAMMQAVIGFVDSRVEDRRQMMDTVNNQQGEQW